jgi:Ca-activated chloride channel family protein
VPCKLCPDRPVCPPGLGLWLWLLGFCWVLVLTGTMLSGSSSSNLESQRISFYVSVFDKDGREVQDLKQGDFQVVEDKVPQTITSLKYEKGATVSLGILIDISRGMGTEGSSLALKWVSYLAGKMKSPDEFFVNSFSDESQEVTDFVSPEDYLEEPLDHLTTGGQSRAGLAVDLGMIKLRDARNAKRGLLMISPGRDIAGRATLEHIARSRYPIYALGYRGGEGVSGALDKLKSLNVKGSALGVYADQSGGAAAFVVSEDEGEKWLDKFYHEFKNQYLLEYQSSNIKSDGKLRKVEVKIKDPALEVRSLKKYQGPVPQYGHH